MSESLREACARHAAILHMLAVEVGGCIRELKHADVPGRALWTQAELWLDPTDRDTKVDIFVTREGEWVIGFDGVSPSDLLSGVERTVNRLATEAEIRGVKLRAQLSRVRDIRYRKMAGSGRSAADKATP